MNNWCDREVTVHLRGGDIKVKWELDGSVWMTGAVNEVYSGELKIDQPMP
jgi:diaminopimelate epimerase